MTNRTRIILSPLAVMALMSSPTFAADEAAVKPEDRVESLLTAIQKNDATAFTTNATPAMKGAITPAVIEDLNHSLGKRLAGKHTTTYLCDLNQKGYRVYLWKLAFTDGGDDLVVRLVLDDKQVLAGFFLQ